MLRNRAPQSPGSRHLLFPAALAIALAAAVALLAGSCGTDSPRLTAPAGTPSTTSTPPSTSEGSDAASSSVPAGAAKAPAVIAPPLQVALFDGSAFDLAGHLSRDGRPVFLHFWSSSCPACLDDLAVLDDAARRHPEILFLGVAVGDDPDAAAAAGAAAAVGYNLGADLDGSAAAAYPADALPAVFLIDSDGTLLGSMPGPLDPEGIDELIDRYLAG